MTGWTCRGTLRGWCRTIHHAEADAAGHVREDDRAARMSGATSDRAPYPYTEGRRTP